MSVSKIVFYLYFAWGVSCILIMSILGMSIIGHEVISFEVVNFFEIIFFVVAGLESFVSLICLFFKKMSFENKLCLIPLVFSAPSIVLFMFRFA